MARENIKTSMHIKDVQKSLDTARIWNQTVNVEAWSLEDGGAVVRYYGWLVKGGYWRGGWHRLMNPRNGQIRTVPDCFIVRFNGHPVHY